MQVEDRVAELHRHQNRRVGFSSRQTNLALEILFIALIVSGLLSWLLPLDRAVFATVTHSIVGFAIVAVIPFKVRGPVRSGFRQRRFSRWVSAAFGVMVISGIGLGVLHSTGIWTETGFWTAMWTHLLLGFVSIPIFIWHVASRRARPSRVDADRRFFLTGTIALAAGATAWGTQELVANLGGPAETQAGTGSHERASFDPVNMPSKRWIDDRAPRGDLDAWDLRTVSYTHLTLPTTPYV